MAGFTNNWPYSDLHNLNLDWIIELIKKWKDDFDTTLETVNDKITYIDNFFSNLDVQDEINNKLDDMTSTGDLARILEPIMTTYLNNRAPATITEWLSSNISGDSTIILDKSLTVEGAAADAQATGKAIDDAKTEMSLTFNNATKNILGELLIDISMFEVGGIAFLSSGFVYQDTNTRVRLKKGFTIHLMPGDIIKNVNPGNVEFFWGRRNPNGSYQAAPGWYKTASPYIVPGEADYSFILEYIPEANIINVQDIITALKIVRPANINKVTYDFDGANKYSINHKGYNVEAPENTLPAFALSKIMGFNFIESDVHMTADNIPVLCHNARINATSNYTGNKTISEMTYQELLQYYFGSWKSPKYAGTRIPTLAQTLALCKNIGMFAFIELKDTTTLTQEQVNIIVDTARQFNMLRSVSWISFSRDYLSMVLNADSGAYVQVIASTDFSEDDLALIYTLDTGHNRIGYDFNYKVPASFFTWANARNIPTTVWTVNDTAIIPTLPTYVVGVTSDSYVYEQEQHKNNEKLASMSTFMNRINIVSGGYTIKNNTVFISAEFTSNYTATNQPRIIIDLPAPRRTTVINIVHTVDEEYTSVPAVATPDGYIFIDNIDTSGTYTISGSYELI